MALPGLRGTEHIGFTVPDLDEAHRFFVDVIGCEYVALGLSVGVRLRDGFARDAVLFDFTDTEQRQQWSNLPEGLAGARDLRDGGRKPAWILGLWLAVVLASSVAARVEHLRYMNRTVPDAPATVAFSREELRVLLEFLRQNGSHHLDALNFPDGIPPLHLAIRYVAELGGYRYSVNRGPPGSIVLTRGLKLLYVAVLGSRTRNPRPKTLHPRRRTRHMFGSRCDEH